MSDAYRKRLVVILQGTALSAASAPESLDSFTSAYEWLRGSPAHCQPRVAPRSLNHGWFGTARWKAVGCSDATSTPWCSEWCGHCRRHSAALQASAITSETTTRASGTRRRSCRCTSARTTFSACSVSDCRQPAPAHAILWITSAHTALRVASGFIGSRIRCSTQALDCAFVAVTAAYAAVHLWETDKFIPGYWRGAPDAFVRDAMVPPHRSLSTLSE